MEIIQNISNWTKELNPILQGVIGSAVFSLLILLGRLLYKFINDLNRTRKALRQAKDITKIILHKKFVNSNGMYYFTQGYLYVIFRALYHLILGLIICLVGYFVSSILGIMYFNLLGIYFGVQELISGLSWINPKWGDKDLTKYNTEIVEKITNSLTSSDPFKGDK